MSKEAEILRRAAALMRERAEAVSRTAPSPWIVLEMEICTDDQEPIEAISVATSQIHWRDADAQRAHVASWHPAVALAVADWLEKTATDFDENTIVDRPDVGEYVEPAPDATWCDYCGGAIASPHYSAADQRCDCYRWPTALAVARAYLGDDQ